MAGPVKVVTVKFETDTTDLNKADKAFQKINKQAKLSRGLLKDLESQKAALTIRQGFARTEKQLKKVNKEIEKTDNQIKKLENTGKKSAGILNSGFKKLGATIAIGLSAAALVGFGRHLNETALRMESFEARAKVVFGRSLGFVEKFGRQNAKSLGLTQNSFLGATAAIADILVPLGFARQESAEMSVELVRLGSALKEFTGDSRSAADIAGIVALATTGEVETLKTLGVVIDQTSKEFKDLVKSKVVDLGFTAQQAKAQAIFEIAMASSTDALKAFDEGANSLTRQQAELEVNLEEVTERLAQAFVPALLAGTKALNSLFVEEEKQSGALKRQQIELNSLVGAITDVNNTEESRSRLIDKLNKQYPAFLDNLDKEKVTNEELEKALEGVNLQFEKKILLQLKEEEITELIKRRIDLERTEIELVQKLSDARKQSDAALTGSLGIQNTREQAIRNTTLALELNRQGQKDLTEEIKNTTSSFDSLLEPLKDVDISTRATTGAQKLMIESLITLKAELSKANEEFQGAEIGSRAFVVAKQRVADLSKEIRDLEKATEGFEFRKLAADTDAVTDATLGLEKAIEGIIIDEDDPDLFLSEEFTDSAIQHAQDIENAIKQISFAIADLASGVAFDAFQADLDNRLNSINEFNENVLLGIDEQNEQETIKLQDQKRKGIITETQFQDQKARLELRSILAKKEIEDKVARETRRLKRQQAILDKAQAIFNIGINTAQGIVAALASVPPNVPLSTVIGVIGALQAGIVAASPLPRFEKGTKDAPGGMSIVGERGQEAVYVPQHAKILPAKQTKRFSDAFESMRDNTFDQKYVQRKDLGQLSTAENMANTMNINGLKYDDQRLRKDVKHSDKQSVYNTMAIVKAIRTSLGDSEHIQNRSW